MSVLIFGYFEQFSTFYARRAPCSAPSCTPDAWTNGPYMTWVIWILVPMVRHHMGEAKQPSSGCLPKVSVDNFATLAVMDQIGIVTTPTGMEIFEGQGHGSLCWTPGGSHMEWRIRSPSRRGDIPLGAPLILAHFEQPK